MQTLVAYVAKSDFDAASVRARVERHYDDWSGLTRHHGVDRANAGVHVWDAPSGCRWPVWSQGADGLVSACLYAPIGYERLVGGLPSAETASELTRRIMSEPTRMCVLTPPFALAALEPGEHGVLHLFTDALGVGRLFQLQTPNGWFFSNRPVAACLAAGVRVRPSRRGWQSLAATDWTMGDLTAVRGVTAVGPAVHIQGLPDGQLRRDSLLDTSVALAAMPETRGTIDELAEEAVASVRASVVSLSRLWGDRPVVDLSGGRDSRLVAAAFVSADVDVRLHSHDGVHGEVDVAEHLVALLPQSVEHHVNRHAPGGVVDPTGLSMWERAGSWHRFGEGLRPSSFLWHGPPDSLSQPGTLVIGGGGGELAHGFYYPDDPSVVSALPSAARVDAMTALLTDRVLVAKGPSRSARRLAERHIRSTVLEASTVGMDDLRALDYFYARERLRRWALMGERVGIVSPLLAPGFVASAFAMTTSERAVNALHVAMLRQMIPAWADVPFFGSADALSRRSVNRLATAKDHARLRDYFLSSPPVWGDDFATQPIQRMWQLSAVGATSPRQERVLARVLWRGAFTEFAKTVDTSTNEPSGLRVRLGLRRI